MNWNIVQGNWKQFRGRVKEQWGNLTDDDLDRISGRRERLLGQLQKKYGITKYEASARIAEWELEYRDDPIEMPDPKKPFSTHTHI